MENLPKLAIVGYGAMGRAIETLAKEQAFVISNIFDIDSKLNSAENYDFDVAIEFTAPDQVIENIKSIAKLHKNIVIGTTGWLDKLDEVREIVSEAGIGLVYSTNFSIGMQMFFRIVRNAAALMNKTDGYDIMLNEMHHHRKKDSPSGSAKTLANIILEEVDTKTTILDDTARSQIGKEMLHLTSTRGGEIFGKHSIYIDSLADTIELKHNAKNRYGFATGALQAAKWIFAKKGIYDFSDYLELMWK